MVDDRLNSCGRFREGRCQRQDDMTRLYLIPQVLEPRRFVEYEKTCFSCRDYLPWSAEGLPTPPPHVDEPPADFWFDGLTLSGSLNPETAYF